MDKEKPHHSTLSTTTSNKSEFFVCFTSRLSSSSSSMKLSSKSILSPSRNRDPPQISLSSSLSRRLKSNGSMKGGQASPMFPTVGKRRGCGFENPEPSSPKVTCIGQVRVKTKKQGKKMRSRSKRRGNGEASFRRGGTEQGFHQVGGGSVGSSNPDLTRQNSQSYQYQNHQNLQQECLKHRNQRWVHLPLTICEALREFSCFFPCRSSCMSKEKSGGELVEVRGSGREGSCGFARWLVALQDGEGKGRGIELVMEHDQEEMEMMEELEMENEQGERSHSQRRHIFEDLDIDVVEGKEQQREFEDGEGDEEEEEKGRVSICIPPKNALLLMRCRSDPVKMAALANRFWESPLHKDQPEEEEQEENENSRDEEEEQEQVEEDQQQQEEEDEEGYKDQHIEMEQVEEVVIVESKTLEEEDSIICERETEEASFVVELEKAETEEEIESRTNEEISEAMEVKDEDLDGNDHKVEDFSCVLVTEADADLEKPKLEDTHEIKFAENDPNEKENEEKSELYSLEPEINEEEAAKTVEGSTKEEEAAAEEEEGKDEIEDPTLQGSDPNLESTEREKGSKEVEREKETLPECLLLMMCEPKLSMEVSKETWVCSTDFVRWLPERPAGKPAGGTKRVIAESSSKPKPKVKQHQPLMQPPRSSCSFPVTGGGGGMSMATMIEQKLVGASKSRNGYEPFVLTRCKSEPMSSAAAKLAPEACFWNNRKLEPHPPSASLGVGAPAGVGF